MEQVGHKLGNMWGMMGPVGDNVGWFNNLADISAGPFGATRLLRNRCLTTKCLKLLNSD